MKAKFLVVLTVIALATILSVSTVQAAPLFAISGAGHTESIVYELDPATGAVIREVGHTGFYGDPHFTNLAFDPVTGTAYAHANYYYGVDDGVLCTIDMATGAATEVTGAHTYSEVPDMTFDSSGTLYAWTEFGFTTDDLITFDLVTGEPTLVGESGINTWRTGLGCDSSDNLYVKTGDELYSVDPSTGVGTYLLSLSGPTHNALAFDEDDTAYSIYREGGTTYLVEIDIATGAVTTIGDIGVANIAAIAFFSGESLFGSINGIVTDADTGDPIAGARIIAMNPQTKARDTTDNDGYYEIPDLEPGKYWVICIARGYKLGIKKADVAAGPPTIVDFGIAPR